MKFVLFVILSLLSLPTFSQRLDSVKAFGTTADEEGMKIIHTKDNGYLIVGRTYYSGNGMYFAKLDSTLKTQWEKVVLEDDFLIWDIVENPDSGFQVCGGYYDTNATYPFIQKLNKKCDTVWSKIFKNWPLVYTYFNKIIQLSDTTYLTRFYQPVGGSNILQTNFLGDSINFYSFYPNAMFAKQDSFILSDGKLFKKFTNKGDLILDKAIKLKHGVGKFVPLFKGGYILLGSGIGVSKINEMGDTSWSMYYTENNLVAAADAKQTLDSGLLVTGTLNDNVYLLKIDKNGRKQWSYSILRPFEKETSIGLILNCDSSITIFEDATDGSIGGEDLFLITLDSMSDVYGTCVRWTGISQNFHEYSDLKIYPVPAREKINIKSSITQEATIKIYNNLGQVVLDSETKCLDQTSIILNNIPVGIYVIKFYLKSPNKFYQTTFLKL